MEENPSLVFTKQLDNAANPAVHFLSTGPEIWAQTQGKVDVFLSGVGTGGTVTGEFLAILVMLHVFLCLSTEKISIQTDQRKCVLFGQALGSSSSLRRKM